MRLVIKPKLLLFLSVQFFYLFIYSQEKKDAGAIAEQLANPVANMISVPFQNNIDYGIGAYRGYKYTLNFQPVIPVSLSPKLNLITRFIVPLVDQHNISGSGQSQFGLSDATVSGFFAPSNTSSGIIWGFGPIMLLPTGTNKFLTAGKWGLGPTGLILRQSRGLTYGMLANQLWSVLGNSDYSNISQLFLQPFITYNWKSGAAIGCNSEMNFNWNSNTKTIFLNPSISGITQLGKQTISMAVGPKFQLIRDEMASQTFGFRASLTLIFPQ